MTVDIERYLACEPALLPEVSAARLFQDVRELSTHVRHAGTPEEARAFDYLQAQLEGLGLCVQRYHCDTLISLPVKASLQVVMPLAFEIPCITHSFAVSTPPEGIEAEAVYIGSGNDEEFRSIALAGKVAIVDGLAEPSKVERSERFGNFSQIFVNDDYRHELIVSQVFGSPVPGTVDNLPHSACVSINEFDGKHLKEFLSGFFDAVAVLDVMGHLPDLSRALSELKRVLKPGGLLIGSFFSLQDSTRGIHMREAGAQHIYL